MPEDQAHVVEVVSLLLGARRTGGKIQMKQLSIPDDSKLLQVCHSATFRALSVCSQIMA